MGSYRLQAGFRTSSNFEGDSTFGILGQLTRRPFGVRGGELRVGLELGTDLGLGVDLQRPFGREGRYFVEPAIEYQGEQVLFDIADERVAEFWQQSFSTRLRIGREMSHWGIIAAEGLYTVGRVSPTLSIAPDLIRTTEYELGGAGVLLAIDTLNQSSWPTQGVQFKANAARLYGIDETRQTDRYSLQLMKPMTVGALGLTFRFAAESIESDDDEPIEILTLGGFRRLSALAENAVPNNAYQLGSVEVFRRLTGADAIVNLPVYLGATLEYATFDLDLFQQGLSEDYVAGSVYLGADTVLGPFFLGLGIGEDDQFSVFLHFGRGF